MKLIDHFFTHINKHYHHRQTSTSVPWDISDDRRSKSHLTPPPPQKRIKSIDLYRAQHGISPDLEAAATIKNLDPSILAAAAALRGRERNRSKENVNRSRDSSSQDLSKTELRDSLLGQALEASSASSVQSHLLFVFILLIFEQFFWFFLFVLF